MTRSDTRYERLDDIERKLARRPEGWTTGELAREYGVDPDTVLRDLNLLEGRGTGLVKQGRRYILDHRRSLHSVKLNSNEVLAFYLAAPRSASVIAEDDVVAWRFSRASLDRLRATRPDVAVRFHEGIAAMLAARLTGANRLIQLLAD